MSGPVIYDDIEQGTDAWRTARLGIPTASEFATVLAKGRGGAESKTRTKYLYTLATEIITGRPCDNYSNAAMLRGHEMEPDARAEYEFAHNVDVQQVAFIRNGQKGVSPDGLVGASGMVEIKSKEGHLLLPILLDAERFPSEHVPQCQGALWVAEREWIDLVVYWPGLPLVVRRAYRDEAYIKALAEAVDVFNGELAAIVEKVRRYGAREAA